LASAIGMKPGALWSRNDTRQPDALLQGPRRAVAIAAARRSVSRRSLRIDGHLATPSRGGRARGYEVVCLIPHDLEEAKVVQTAVYGGTLVAIGRQLRRRSTGCAPSWPANTRTGRSST